jgi:gliding motility-associated-like protein
LVAAIVDGSIHIVGTGTATITATQAAQGNYAAAEAVTQDLTITPAALQLTVDNQNRTYGQANPELTYSYTGFITGDSESSLTALPVLSTTADAGSLPGDYPITAIGAASPNYTISVTGGTLTVLASTDATLSALAVSTGTLSPSFDPAVNSYGVTVGNTITTISLTPAITEATATATVNGAAVNSGNTSAAIPLTVGDNPIPVVVTAQDGSTANTYTVTVTRSGPPSTMAGLGITLNAGTPLVQTQGPANVNVSSTVAYSVSSIKVKAYVLEAHATITVNGAPQANNVLSDPIALAVGTNIINVVGTAQDGVTTRSYRITVTRNSPSANIADVSIALSPNITLNTTSGSADFNYAASVANTVSNITVTPTATSPVATIKLNGATVATGTANPIALNAGTNTIDVTGTSQDGTVTKSYRITITRAFAGSNMAGLGVTLNAGTPLVQTGGPANVNVSSTVAYSVSTIKVKAYVLEAHATIKINGAPQANNVLSDPIALGIGDNIINVVGTAQDGITTRTYRITVTRTAPPANIADVSFTLSPNITLTTVSGSADFNYAATVANTISNLVITPTAASPSATITVNGTVVTTGTAYGPIALNTGINTIDIVGTSQDGTVTKSYRITITRGMPGSNMAGLGITLNAGTPLVQVSGPADVNSTSTVANGISSISVKAYVLEPNATITINGAPQVSNVLSDPIALSVGDNIINVVGTAQDAITTRSYRITVTRSAPAVDVADLMIALNPNTPLTQVSGSADVNYTAAVANSVTQVSVIPTAASTTATITVNGTAVATGTASGPIALSTGTNIINVVGTSQDGTAIKTYRITLTRAQPGSNVAGLGITLSEGTRLVQTAGPANVNVSSTVANSITSVRVKAYVLEAHATITLNGAPQANNVLSGPIALAVGDNIINVLGTAQDGTTTRSYRVTVTRAAPSLFAFNPHAPGSFSDTKEIKTPADGNDGVVVHQGVSPNGDGMNDFLAIEGVSAYPDNKLSIMNASGALVFETKGYGTTGSNLFDGHSNKNGSLLKPGTYFYALEYRVDKESKRKTGYIILKY